MEKLELGIGLSEDECLVKALGPEFKSLAPHKNGHGGVRTSRIRTQENRKLKAIVRYIEKYRSPRET